MIVALAGGVAYAMPAAFGPTTAHYAAVSPSPSPSSTAPFQNEDSGNGSGAGSIAFLLIVVLIAVSVLLFWAMNRSLKRARRNLGGEPLPRRPGQRPRATIPTREDPPADGGAGTQL